MKTVTAYIGLGSNLGDRQANLDGALRELRERKDIAVNSVRPSMKPNRLAVPRGRRCT